MKSSVPQLHWHHCGEEMPMFSGTYGTTQGLASQFHSDDYCHCLTRLLALITTVFLRRFFSVQMYSIQICPILLSSGWIWTSSSPWLVKLCNYGTMLKLINPCGNMASLQNRQVSVYLSASGHTNAYLKIHSSPTRQILFTTHMHKYACLYMHPECTEYSCPDIYASVNAEKNPYILAPTKLKTDKQREKIIYSANFNFTLKMSGR